MFGRATLAFGVGLLSVATAQTYSDCNPLKKTTCSPDAGLSKSTYSIDFTKGSDDDAWKSVGSGSVDYTSSGAEFTINKQGDAPTIETNWYIFFGRVEIHMKSAAGTGIVSSAVLLSDVLDEVDWEWLGGDAGDVQTNYYGKGNTTLTTRENTFPVSATQSTSHNYTIDWTHESCIWYVDTVAVRTLAFADALGGENYPQTPMRVKLGIWAGGDSDNAEGTIEWAGGETDYDAAPFTMVVESVEITNFNPGGSYTYSDQTGDYGSIDVGSKVVSDDSSTTDSQSKTKTTTTTTKASGTKTSVTSVSSSTSTSTSVNVENNAAAKASDSSTSTATSTSDSSSTSEVATITSSATGSAGILSANGWMAAGLCVVFMLRHV
ncbi:hypothetical protein G7046_g7787 [Stylonectria norvegica]|nr:hypothetical protein G7046_g7787 [Stylonectria norvegica]